MKRDVRGSLLAKSAALLLLFGSLIGAVYSVAGTALKSVGCASASSFYGDRLFTEPFENGAMPMAFFHYLYNDYYYLNRLDTTYGGFSYRIYDGDPEDGALLDQHGDIPDDPVWEGSQIYAYDVYGTVPEGVSAEYCTVVGAIPSGIFASSTNVFSVNRAIYQLYRTPSLQDLTALAVLMCLAFLALLTFLLCAAGHRRGMEGIVPNFQDHIPLDLYLIVDVAAFALLAVLVENSRYHFYNAPYLYVPLIALGAVGAFILAVATLMTLATRLKLGKWWRNTVCYRLLRWCWRLWKRMWWGFVDLVRILPMTWRTVLLVGGVLVAQVFLTLLMFESYNGGFFFLITLAFDGFLVVAVARLTVQLRQIKEMGRALAEGDLDAKIDTRKMYWDVKSHAEDLNDIGDGMTRAVEQRLKSERLKTELITNVSHDIKTPLTSIINYVDLLQKEDLPETANEYLEVLARQSARLKKLTEDLVEASKASTGNIAVSMEPIVVNEIIHQAVGDYDEKLAAGNLEVVVGSYEGNLVARADGRLLWRVLDNLLSNVCKYALAGTRVYVDLTEREDRVYLTMKNISRDPLNISAEELTERFVRGDSSRHTEGSGLGLNIAQSLMDLMGGTFRISVDGDLFKAELSLPKDTPAHSIPPDADLSQLKDAILIKDVPQLKI